MADINNNNNSNNNNNNNNNNNTINNNNNGENQLDVDVSWNPDCLCAFIVSVNF